MTDTPPANFASRVLHAHEKMMTWRLMMENKVSAENLHAEPAYIWTKSLCDITVFTHWTESIREYVLAHQHPGPQPFNETPVITATHAIHVLLIDSTAKCAQSVEMYRPTQRNGGVFTKLPRASDAVASVAYPMARGITLFSEIELCCVSNYHLTRSIYIPLFAVDAGRLTFTPPLLCPVYTRLSVEIDMHARMDTPQFKTQVVRHTYNTDVHESSRAYMDTIPYPEPVI